MEKMKNSYYKKPGITEKVEEFGLKNVMFPTQPCEGAFIISIWSEYKIILKKTC